jgi:HK97 gp10 family phage protein
MGFDMTLKGLDLFEKEVKSVNNRFQKANVAATRAGGNVVKREAKNRIHNISGDLAKSIAVKIYKKRPTNSIALVGPNFPGMTAQQKSYYGSWVEEGHKNEFGDSETPPHPFLRPALDESKSEIKTKMVQAYQKALEKNFKAESMIEELGENIIDSFGGGEE